MEYNIMSDENWYLYCHKQTLNDVGNFKEFIVWWTAITSISIAKWGEWSEWDMRCEWGKRCEWYEVWVWYEVWGVSEVGVRWEWGARCYAYLLVQLSVTIRQLTIVTPVNIGK
jgi:hypothetical protein